MIQVGSEYPAVQRARWLAELAEALDDAAALLEEIAPPGKQHDLAELSARIEMARIDLEVMRIMRTRSERRDFRLEWTKQVPWELSA